MSRPRRLEGVAYTGPARYFLTFCVHARAPAFTDATVVAQALLHIRRVASRQRFAILAYCFMPDHLHLLVEGTEHTSQLREFARLAKQASGFAYRQATERRLWQDGYYERILRQSEEARQVAAYIVANPCRAGLVATPAEYPFLGSDLWSLEDLLDSVQ